KCPWIAHTQNTNVWLSCPSVYASIDAKKKLAVAIAALLDIPVSRMVRDLICAAMSHFCFTTIWAYRSPKGEDRLTSVTKKGYKLAR
ncbi:MAG: hypothetical protein NWQ23_05160, partial [Yoonia sp.]|uniref:hypothetical protein n=1 Tax=Yoonia sp. TaxID=2212373 RepID=UPI00273EC307